MKTIAEASKMGINEKLIRAVIRQTGKESLPDIMNHGADSGYPGLTYYRDTVAFFKRNRQEIVALVEEMADSLGENPADMVAGFNCLAGRTQQQNQQDNSHLREYLPSVCRCLYGGRLTDDDTQVANALAWFAAEEVARAMCDE